MFKVLKTFFGVPHLATYIFFNCQIEPELGAGIDPGMAFTLFPYSILDDTRFELTTFRVKFAINWTRVTPFVFKVIVCALS